MATQPDENNWLVFLLKWDEPNQNSIIITMVVRQVGVISLQMVVAVSTKSCLFP